MASYFELELDTTPPEIEIFAPSYASSTSPTSITIEANETLSTYQDIYLTDQKGNRIDLTFLHENNKFIGYVDFSNGDGGIYTLYAQVKDEVHNTSELISRSIRIIGGEPLILTIADFDRKFNINEISRTPLDNLLHRDVIDNTTERRLYDITSDRKLEVRSGEVRNNAK